MSDLRKTYSGPEADIIAIDDISFSIGQGEIVGILGPNGAGKTTTIKSILGLIEPSNGTVLVNDINPHEDPNTAYQYITAVLEGARNLYWRLTVRENIRYFTGLQGIHPDKVSDEHDRLLSLVGLENKADESVRNLSRGMQQKACLACALARQTPVLFLDEPTLGLDVEASRDLQLEIQRLAEEELRTIVLSSHDMDVIQEVCDKVIIMKNGSVIAKDSVEALLNLFNTRTFQIKFHDSVTDNIDISAHSINWSQNRTTLEASLRDGNDIYEIMEELNKHNSQLKSISSTSPDLESAFLSIIEDNETEKYNND